MDLQQSSRAQSQIKQMEALLKELRKSTLRSTDVTVQDLERELEESQQIQLDYLLHPKNKRTAEKAFLIYHNTIKRLLEIISEIKSAH